MGVASIDRLLERLWRAPLGRLVTGLLVAQLLIAPPSMAVCWSLPGGAHLHIGWTDAAGQPTLMPQVFLHGATEPPASPDHLGQPAVAQMPAALLGSPLTVPSLAGWLFPAAALTWLGLRVTLSPIQCVPSPLRHPPRQPRIA